MCKAGKKRMSNVAKGVAAVGVVTSVAAVAATQPESISAPLVDLAALIVVGSSTHWDGSGNENFYGGKFNQPPYTTGGVVHVNFLTGPSGINQALQANSDDPENLVLASGWGAANASLLLTHLDSRNDPALANMVWVLDNNVSRANGGFGTRYPAGAFIGINPIPTPTDTGALAVVDIGYQYDYNSNAPADLVNVVAHLNSLVAWTYTRLNHETLELPVNPDGTPAVTCGNDTCAVLESDDPAIPCPDARCAAPADDRIVAYVMKREGSNTTYVTYTTDGLPLVQPLRDFVPVFGDLIADVTEPVLTVIVNAAYPDNNPIPSDPSKYTPATLVPPPSQLATAAAQIPGAIQEGLTAATDDPSPTSTVTTDVASIDEESPSPAPPVRGSKPLTNVVRESDKAVPGSVGSISPSTNGTDPVGTVIKSVIDNLNQRVQNVVGGFGTKPDDANDTGDDSDGES